MAKTCSNTIALVATLLFTSTSSEVLAQGGEFEPGGRGFFLVPTLRLAGVYDDNLFFRSQNPVETRYLCISPGLHADYRSPRFQFRFGGSFDGELFPSDTDQLSETFARTEVEVALGYTSSPRTQVTAEASFLSTFDPGELISPTGLDLGRQPATGIGGRTSWSRALTPRQKFELGYDFGRTDLDRTIGPPSRTGSHVVTGVWRYGTSPRTSIQLGYVFRWFVQENFSDLLGESRNTLSHTVSAGLLRQFTPATSISLRVGPRLSFGINPDAPLRAATSSRMAVEAEASFQHERRRTQLSITYSRAQNPAFGFGGFVNTDSVSFGWDFQPRPQVRFRLSPGAFQNRRAGENIVSYQANADFTLEVSKWLLVTTAYSYSAQDGQFLDTAEGTGVSDEWTTRNTITLVIALGHPLQVN